MLWALLILLLVAAIAAIVLGDAGSLGGMTPDMIVGLAASVALLALFLGHVTHDYAGRFGRAVKDFAIWVAIALVLIIGYAFRGELETIYQRVAGELLPPGTAVQLAGRTDTERAIQIRKSSNGHFVVRSEVNGQPVRMLVDTGATSVVLTTDDARAAGIDVDRLRFSIRVRTANGTGSAAAVRLDSISVGGIERRDLEALVARPGALTESLLGMNFLEELRSYEFSKDFLTIRG